MMQERHFDLLIDIARLLKKYGPRPFESLAIFLSSKEGVEQLNNVLRGALQLSSAYSKKTGTKTAARNFLDNFKQSDPEKYDLLVTLQADLRSKHVLPTLRDLTNFAKDNGLEVTSKKRPEAITQLVRQLAVLPIEDLKRKLKLQRSISDRSLEGWSDLILRKRDG